MPLNVMKLESPDDFYKYVDTAVCLSVWPLDSPTSCATLMSVCEQVQFSQKKKIRATETNSIYAVSINEV